MKVYVGGTKIGLEQLAGVSLPSQRIVRIFLDIALPSDAWQHVAVVSDHGQHEVRVLTGPVGDVNPLTAIYFVTFSLDGAITDHELKASIVAQLVAFWQAQAGKATVLRAECHRILASLQPGTECTYLTFQGSRDGAAQKAALQLAQAFPALDFEVKANGSSTFIRVSGPTDEIGKFRALFEALSLV